MENANNSLPSFPSLALTDLVTVTKLHSLYYYEFPADYFFTGERHDFWDVLAGAAIGVGSAYIYTRPFAREHNVVIGPAFTPDGTPAFYFSMNF